MLKYPFVPFFNLSNIIVAKWKVGKGCVWHNGGVVWGGKCCVGTINGPNCGVHPIRWRERTAR